MTAELRMKLEPIVLMQHATVFRVQEKRRWSFVATPERRLWFHWGSNALIGACLLLFLCLPSLGQTAAYKGRPVSKQLDEIDDDPLVIVEVGAATSWNTTGGAATFAPNFAAETTPIENWLELEAGTSPFYTRNTTEWDTDLLFKKPWTLSRKAEFMLGVGPVWVYLKQSGRSSNTLSGEIAGDFMFWPSGRHHFGWYLEPAYDYNFAAGHQQSIGMSAGLLIGLKRRRR